MPIKSRIRTIPDFPKPGIQFRDITTLLQDPEGLRLTIDTLATAYRGQGIVKVAGIESRGFIVGAALAHQLGAGFVLLRKPGKLPGATVSQEYQLEYGTDRLELHVDAIAPGERVLLVDDLIATGGTAEAAATLIRKVGGELVGTAFIIDLPDLGGRGRLEALGHEVYALCRFEGE
jgi:adenine phosphoribosyltransferase